MSVTYCNNASGGVHGGDGAEAQESAREARTRFFWRRAARGARFFGKPRREERTPDACTPASGARFKEFSKKECQIGKKWMEEKWKKWKEKNDGRKIGKRKEKKGRTKKKKKGQKQKDGRKRKYGILT
jgi:hypothetical protein